MRLQRGGRVPHFDVTDVKGAQVRYADGIWQSRNLLLVSLRERDGRELADYVQPLIARREAISAEATALVVTTERIDGVPRPGLLMADKWGEIYFVVDAGDVSDLPDVDGILDWLHYVQHECPECQGEVK